MEVQVIQDKIHEIRGRRVMLDFDLAALYGIETRVLKQSVRRNMKRFDGDDFMFVPSAEELSRSQIVTLNKGRGYNLKYLPFAFTELGVSMSSSVLKSDTAIDINRNIMRAFVTMRQYLASTVVVAAELAELRALIGLTRRDGEETLEAVNDLSEDTRRHIDNLYNAIGELSIKPPKPEKPRRPIGYPRNRE